MTIQEMFLTPNKYSRPQTPLKEVDKVVVHYIGNPNTTALQNRTYFENQKNGGRYVSSHYIVGLKGEVLQCVPLNEIAYCSNNANSYSISIETCHPDATGKFTDITYISLCELCAMLLKKYNLGVNDLLRHYDILRDDGSRKQCPLHWCPTKYQSEAVATARWNRFKQDVQTIMNGGKVTRNNTVDITETSVKNDVSKPTTSTTTTMITLPYKAKVKIDSLNVRSGAGLGNPVILAIKKNAVYTIVEEKKIKNTDGSVAVWGLLKAYQTKRNGWINVGSAYVTKIK